MKTPTGGLEKLNLMDVIKYNLVFAPGIVERAEKETEKLVKRK